jgi:hypothetical protein
MQITFILATCGLLLLTLPAHAQSFSCGIGDRPSCLGYGDTVCSSQGKCVGQNAQCFDSFQCNYEGFTCRSNVTSCVDDYDELLRTHNTLVREYNDLLDERDELREDLRDLVNIASDLEDDLQNVEACLLYASNLDQARFCSR